MTSTVQLAFRFDAAVVEAIDAIARDMSAERPGLDVTRSDVVRIAVQKLIAERGITLQPAVATDDGADDLRRRAGALIAAGRATQAELARRSGLDTPRVSRFLAGQRGLRADGLRALTRAVDAVERHARKGEGGDR